MKITELKNLQEGEIVEVKGSLMYSKYLTKRLEGQELEERIKSDSKFSDYPNENPRFEFQIFDPAVVKKGDNYAGLVVDNLIGQQEIVIKSLGKTIDNNKIINGATILGDGEVALIIDVNALV